MISALQSFWIWLTGSFAGKIVASFFVSMIPVVELRAGVPLAVGMGLEPQVAIPLCMLSNMIPIIPVIVCIQHILRWMRHHGKRMRRAAILLERRVKRNRKLLDRYAWVGLMILTAIPVPGTGAWTASMLAGLTGVRIRYAFPAIALGVVIAAFIMGILSYGVAAVV